MRNQRNRFEVTNNRRTIFLVVLALLIVVVACQRLPEARGNVNNPESRLLKILIQPGDLSGNWKWIDLSVDQPSQVQWIEQDQLIDSATTGFAGKLYDGSGKESYISIFHTVAQYSIPAVSTQPIAIHSAFENVTSSFVPEFDLPTPSDSVCFVSSESIDCSAVTEVDQVVSIISLIAPLEFENGATSDLLGTIIQITENKIGTLQAQ